MTQRLRIPKLGMSMAEAVIVEWLVADGDAITADQPLYIVETDKSQIEITSPVSGRITLIGEIGKSYDLGTVIAEVT